MKFGPIHLQTVYRMILLLSFLVVAFNVYSYRVARRDVTVKSYETGSGAVVVNTQKTIIVREDITPSLSPARYHSSFPSTRPTSTKLPGTVSNRLVIEEISNHPTTARLAIISNFVIATRSKAKSTVSSKTEKETKTEAKEIKRKPKQNSTAAAISSEPEKKHSKHNLTTVTNSSKLEKKYSNHNFTAAPNWSTLEMTSEMDLGSIDEYQNMGGIGPRNESGSVVVNPHPFNFTISPTDVCDDGSGPVFLLVYIHTRPENIKHRHLIRSTWGKVDAYRVTVRRIFVMGLPNNPQVQDAIAMESSLYQDLLQEDFIDSYQNLTYKALGALKWVANFCAGARFVMKTDDDAFVSMPLLIQTLEALTEKGRPSRTLYCNLWYGSDVSREGKWAVTVEQRKYPWWPPFCQGLAYVMTPDLPGAFYNASFDLPFLWMDDVYVTGFLAKRLGVDYSPFAHLFVPERWLRSALESPDEWNRTIFAHVHDFDLAKWAWSRAKRLFDASGSNPKTKIGRTSGQQHTLKRHPQTSGRVENVQRTKKIL